jgi:hypothetical protein
MKDLQIYANTSVYVCGVLTVVDMKNSVVWDITPCSPMKVNESFGDDELKTLSQYI